MKRLAAFIVLGLLACSARLEAAEAEFILRKVSSFAVGGVGVVGTMSEGERALRKLLKQSDAVARMESVLPEASPAGQLYALLGLRSRDRDAYKRALTAYGQRNAAVQTIRGCSVGTESFRDLVKQIDRGDYDSSLTRQWPARAR